MHGNPLFAAADISASGLAAERMRLEVVANNIANAYSTRSPSGGPYRRQDVLFSAVLSNSTTRGAAGRRGALAHPGGVQVLGVVDDMSELHRIHNPGHPDADPNG